MIWQGGKLSLEGRFEGLQLLQKLKGHALLALVNPPDHGRAREGDGVVLPGELRGQEKVHFCLFILLEDGPGWTHNKNSPLGQVLGYAFHFFRCAS